jgi:hypothetical protein
VNFSLKISGIELRSLRGLKKRKLCFDFRRKMNTIFSGKDQDKRTFFERELFHVRNEREPANVSTVIDIGLRKRLPFVDVVVARSSSSHQAATAKISGRRSCICLTGPRKLICSFKQSARAPPELTRVRRKCLLHIPNIAACATTLKIY